MEKFWEFLSNLSKETRLFILSLSVCLAVISLADPIPGLQIKTLEGRVLLFLIALFLIGFSVWAIAQNEKSQHSSHASGQEVKQEQARGDDLKKELDKRVEELRTIEAIVSGKDDPVSLEISRVLARVSQLLVEEQVNTEDLKTAAGWIDRQADAWASAIQQSDIPGGLSSKEIKILREEIRQHIHLLSKNLVGGVFGSPKKHNIPQTLGSSFIYKDALITVRRRMVKELEDPKMREILGIRGCQEVRTYMDALIEDA